MTSEEILGGLKGALARGESLKQAMMSFYNAGYKKEDIEVAARALLQDQQAQLIQAKEPFQKKVQQPKPVRTIQRVSNYGEKPTQLKIQSLQKIKKGIDTAIKQLKEIPIPTTQKLVQRVSNYEQSKPKRKWILFLMIFLLLVLLGILAGVYFFKQEIMDFFSNLF